MSHILTMNRKLRRDARGVTAIEYGLLVALIIIACIAALSLTGTDIKSAFATIGNSLKSVTQSSPYSGLTGIAAPSGPVTFTTETIDGEQVSGYAYANGTFYSANDPYRNYAGQKYYIAFKDGFVLQPGGQGSNGTPYSDFVSGCSGNGGTGFDDMAGSYTGGGTVSTAANGDWVCSGVQAVSGGWAWVYDSVK